MNVEITARHGSVPEGVKDHAREKLEQALRHAKGIISAHVILDFEKSRQTAEMIVHGRNLTATVHAESDDVQLSIDRCAEKLRHQLERHLGKKRARRRRALGHDARAQAELAAMEQAAALESREAEPSGEATEAETEAESEQELPPERVQVQLKTLSVSQALDELALAVDGLVVFTEGETGRVLVLYERDDGRHVLLDTGSA